MDKRVEVTQRQPKEITPGKVKVAYAAFVDIPEGGTPLYGEVTLPSLSGTTQSPDKMVIPEEFHKRVKLVRYYYELDPIAHTVIDKILDIGVSSLTLDRNECSDEEFLVYDHVRPIFEKYLQQAGLEYLLSGLVLPRTVWGAVPYEDIEGLTTVKLYELPTKSWIINPEYIELIQVPLLDDVVIVLHVPAELKNYVLNNGKLGSITYPAGIDELKAVYPEVLRALTGKTKRANPKVVLENQFMIRRRAKSFDPYPTPFLLAALESLMFKRNLKKMDFSIASRVISAIQLIKLGNDEYPLTEDDEDQLDDLKAQMLWRSRAYNIDRVFQLFANHTLAVEWVYPDTEAMLNSDKYEIVNQDIFYAVGFPRILLSGETMRSATSQAEFAMFSPAETIRRFREEILKWVNKLVDEIQTRNSFTNKVTPRFEELRLYDLSKLVDLVVAAYQSNALSLTSLDKALGFEFEDEVVMKSRERELLKKYGLPEVQPQPFTPKSNVPGEEKQDTPADKEV